MKLKSDSIFLVLDHTGRTLYQAMSRAEARAYRDCHEELERGCVAMAKKHGRRYKREKPYRVMKVRIRIASEQRVRLAKVG